MQAASAHHRIIRIIPAAVAAAGPATAGWLADMQPQTANNAAAGDEEHELDMSSVSVEQH